jgi:NADH:ubiquinone oxidoreductase subunit 5 (subunit L)/multisubunit Na+/H+ antiporter MnhA subunit
MGNVIDMRRFGGLRHVLKTTHWVFLCGAGALSGFPIFFSGFWSKDEILAVALEAGQGSFANGVYLLLFVLALLTAGLTAFYTFRAYFLTFWGEVRIPAEAGEHVHESPPVMLVPMQILAVGAVVLGIALGPTGLFSDFLRQHWTNPAFRNLLSEEADHHNLVLMVVSSLVALAGIGLAWWMYVRQPSAANDLVQALPGPYEWARNKFYLDEIYAALVVAPMTALAHLARIFDLYVVDAIVDLLGQVPRLAGYMFRPIQNGLVQFYALLMILGVAGFLLSVLMR